MLPIACANGFRCYTINTDKINYTEFGNSSQGCFLRIVFETGESLSISGIDDITLVLTKLNDIKS